MNIIGAGLSGLICGALNAQSQIYERNAWDVITHRAVLRFRDDKIARALGLTFRRITVHKAIWYDGLEADAAPRFANMYSLKVRGVVADNSSWNLAPSERFIAPDNFHAILADICGTRVHWSQQIDSAMLAELCEGPNPVISTIPLPLLLSLLAIQTSLEFKHSSIIVDRFHVQDCDVFQTLYFPHPQFAVYRATLTGDLLTVESYKQCSSAELNMVLIAFGLTASSIVPFEVGHKQHYGKIVPVPDGERKALLHLLTQQFGIYTLGRFGVWKNILLDDVFDDISVVRKMIAISKYDVQLERVRNES